jgi:hypothetical protein
MEENKPSGISVPKDVFNERRNEAWKSNQIDQLAEALSKAQSEMKGAKKSSQGYNWKYADLHTVITASFPYLTKYGLSIVQGSNKDKDGFHITTTLLHSSGQWMRSWLKIPVEKLTAQQIGTAVTYGRRYGMAAMVGIAQHDDDGHENKVLLEEIEKQS